MRILVFGAGVIGCELAHELYQGGNDVTILARGEWKDKIDHNGLTIYHYGQLRTTNDSVNTIEKLEPIDCYDIIFVVMQYSQVIEVLPQLATNMSRHIVLVGNNVTPSYCEEQIIKLSTQEKNIAFGFQGTGGRRETNRVISMHFKVSMTIGGLRNNLSDSFKHLIEEVFCKTRYTLKWESHMEGWLLSHAAHILPTAYLCYILNCDLKKVNKKQVGMAVDAVAEAHNMLKQLGYSIRPNGEEDAYVRGRRKKLRGLYIMVKSPAGKFVISTHCANAVGEMTALDNAFEALRHKANVPMPSWDILQKASRAALNIKINH